MADWVNKIVNPCCEEITYYFNDDENFFFVDPGNDTAKIFKALGKFDCKEPKIHILLTHGHYDHIASVKPLCEECDNVKIYVSENEKDCLFKPSFNLSPEFKVSYDLKDVEDKIRWLKDGEKFEIGRFHFKVLSVPGHTKGGQFIIEEWKKVIFSGDSLFRRSIGNTSFPGGDHSTLISSLKRVLAEIPDDYIVLPGHDQSTTIGEEKKHNPYL